MMIQLKLVTAFLAIAILVGAVGAISFNNLQIVGNSFYKVHQKSTPAVIALATMKSSMLFLISEANEVTMDATNEHLEAFEQAKQEFDEACLKYQKLVTEDRDVVELKKGAQEIVALVDEMIELKKDRASQEVLLEKAEEFNEKAEEFSHMINSEIRDQNIELEQSQLGVEEKIQSASDVNLAFTLIALSSAIGMGLFIARSIYMPLRKLKDAAKQIAVGNHDTEIRPSSADEIGELASQFEIMRRSVRETNINLNQLVQMRTAELEKTNVKLKSANEELTLKDKLKDEFISIASHELRTPIQPILGSVDLATKGFINHVEAFHIITRNAKRLQKLATDILDVSRMETDQITYKMAKVDLNYLIRDIVKTAKVNLNGDVSITTSLDNDGQINADKDRITQVLINVIDNAIKFTKRGTIKVEKNVSADKNKVTIKVTDTGTGIPNYVLSKLFGKFVTSSARDMNINGVGLGLFISKAIVNAHKGEISGCNNSEGGATFTIVLPIDSDKRMN